MNSLYGALAPSIQFTTTFDLELGDCGYKKKKVKEEEERDEKRDQIFLVNSSIYIIFFFAHWMVYNAMDGRLICR